jgi:hypothetical protein
MLLEVSYHADNELDIRLDCGLLDRRVSYRLHLESALKVEAICSFKTLVTSYKAMAS